jgi:hypothetical protein
MIFYGAILTIDTKPGENTLGIYPVGVEANSPHEAEGKLLRAARRSFPNVRIEVKVNTGHDPVISDPEKAGVI